MNGRFLKRYLKIIIVILLGGCSSIPTVTDREQLIENKIIDLREAIVNKELKFNYPERTELLDVIVDDLDKNIIVEFNKIFSYIPFREDNVEHIYSEVKDFFGPMFYDYSFIIMANNVSIEELVPNYYRSENKIDEKRISVNLNKHNIQVVKNISKPFIPINGLFGKNVALWHSHGWYYNYKLDRWLWQRARLFQIVEDLGPITFTLPYIIPMLENAGANVYLPRERDIQTNEVIIDNDTLSKSYIEKVYNNGLLWKTGKEYGFYLGNPPYPANYNPFSEGSHRIIQSDEKETANVSFIPDIPERGKYAVYVAYVASPNNVNDAHYTVYHLGGKTDFQINQQIGGNTWIYLGHFKFKEGRSEEVGKVVLSNRSKVPGKLISSDAVRFGGGMGIISRNGKTSGRPKYVEAARYYLQFSGMPDSLVYNLNGDTLDYNDDYQSRGEWVNFLYGAPYGPNENRSVKGLGIPIDVSLSFHTDAGITNNDTVIGTLSIYSIFDLDSNKVFPDGISRLANRDFADIIQTQIVDDIKFKYDPAWTRRWLWDARYSEAARPNVPSVLLELLSHQNYIDVKFQLDPRFRFDVSRSIYKAILKFVSFQYDYDYVVQPLPVTHFSVEFINTDSVKLNWRAQLDPLEPTSVPEKYIIYTRIGQGGFDNGKVVNSDHAIVRIERDNIYSFKITAVNEGGESFPSEILSVARTDNDKKPALIVNCFDRVSAPASVNTDTFSGFLDFIDSGVPDKLDIGYTGMQHDFNPKSKWLSDDIPGHGASYADMECHIIAGNTFDFPYIHGEAIYQNGYSFVSVSDESVYDSLIDMNNYEFVDLILGEEKETYWPKEYSDSTLGIQYKTFPDPFKKVIESYLNNGGKLFASGSYIGSDLFLNKVNDHPDRKFATSILHYDLDSDHAVKNGAVLSIDNDFLPEGFEFIFNTELNDKIYAAEATDAIGPVNGSKTILRYKENLYSAAVAYNEEYGVISFGFPFETIIKTEDRFLLMKAVFNYFNL
ncbi:fibronectin type III domain-containing protein [Bacteroidota bacterium]